MHSYADRPTNVVIKYTHGRRKKKLERKKIFVTRSSVYDGNVVSEWGRGSDDHKRYATRVFKDNNVASNRRLKVSFDGGAAAVCGVSHGGGVFLYHVNMMETRVRIPCAT